MLQHQIKGNRTVLVRMEIHLVIFSFLLSYSLSFVIGNARYQIMKWMKYFYCEV